MPNALPNTLDEQNLDSIPNSLTDNLTSNLTDLTNLTNTRLKPEFSDFLASDFASSHAYFGVFVLFALSFIAFNYTLKIQRFISRKIATKSRDKLKLAPYECGPTPLKQPTKIPHQFFIIALLFVLFDIEVVFMIPWAVVYKEALGSGFGVIFFIEMISFIFLLVIGLVYAWKKGALQWHTSSQSSQPFEWNPQNPQASIKSSIKEVAQGGNL